MAFLLVFSILFVFNNFVFGIQSPCPHIFQYSYDNNRILRGLISAPIPNNFGSLIQIKVEFQVAHGLQTKLAKSNIGKLDVIDNSEVVIQKIKNNQPLLFTLDFPHLRESAPKVTKIFINGNQICSGNLIPHDSAESITTVNLVFNLTITYGHGQNSLPHNYFQPQTTKNYWTTKPNIYFYTPPTTPIPPSAASPPTNVIHTRRKPPTTIINNKPEQAPDYYVNSFKYACGLEDKGISLIAKGEVAKKSDHPWLGALFKTTTLEAKFLCGATLITNKHGLTAGHCIYGTNPKRLYLILGRENILNWLSEGEQIQVIDLILHHDFVVRHGDGDLGILVLSREVKLSFAARPICLWNDNDDSNSIVGMEGTVVGWGQDERGNSPSTVLQVTMPVVNNEDCIRSNPIFTLITSPRTFCAGKRNGAGPCKGDSGSGFYLKERDRWSIRGIVSQGISANDTSCDLGNYVVFIDVAKYREWILVNIRK